MTLPIAEIEQKRLAALHHYQILDTQPEEYFDRLCKLAAISCDVPIALISLLDEHRHWFKSKIGIELHENPSNLSFCQYTLRAGAYTEIQDTQLDTRTAEHPLVKGAPHIRFYAAQPIFDPDGYMIGTVCVYDFKPKKLNAHQQEILQTLALQVMTQILLNQRQRKQQQYHDFFNTSADLFCITDLKGKFTDINPALTDVLGWQHEEFIQKSWMDFIHPEDRVRSKKEFNKIVEGKNTLNFINRFQNKKGNYLWLRWKVVLDNYSHQAFFTAQDISKEKEIEQITKSLYQFQSAILNGTAYAIIATDAQGIITSFNSGATQMLGYSSSEVLYQQTPVIFHDEQEILRRTLEIETQQNTSLNGGLETLTFVLPNEKENINQWTYRHKDGTEIPVLLSVNALKDQHHNISGYLYIAQDITTQIANEKELLKAKEQAEKNASDKDIFLTNVSHEIRTPMNAIIGFSEILINTPLNAEQKEFMKAINVASENLMVIINDILDFSKIESGTLQLSHKPCSIQHILKNAHKLLSEKARAKNIDFNLKIGADIPAWVSTDQARLNQILINIIGNAIKFTDKGRIDISCKLITQDAKNCIIEFKIKDTGIGIKKEKQKIIFNRFAQAEEHTNALYGGNGLGLSITKQLVELFKGDISVYSESGQGAEFIITLPFIKTQAQDLALEDHHPESTQLQTYRVLLAEDNELNQKLGQNVLQQFGMEVDIAENGLEAVKLFETNSYDLIFLDLQMPEMDGYDAAVYIRNELKSEVPIIAMTAHSLIGEKEKCLSLGMTEYISKPYRPNDIYQKIKSIEHLMKSPLKRTQEIVPPVTSVAPQPFNLDLIREFCNHDEKEVEQCISVFTKQAEKDLTSLEKSIQEKNTQQTSFIAHRIKSSLAAFGSDTAKELALSIELQPAAENIIKTMEELKQSIEELITAFRKIYPD